MIQNFFKQKILYLAVIFISSILSFRHYGTTEGFLNALIAIIFIVNVLYGFTRLMVVLYKKE